MKLLNFIGVVLLLTSLSAVVWTYEVNPPDFTYNIWTPLILLMAFGTLSCGIVSFYLGGRHLRPIHTRTIATVFLIVAISVPATFYYSYQTVQMGCLCSNTGRLNMVLSASISVPSDNGTGTLSVQVESRDTSGDSPLTQIFFTDDGLTNVGTVPNVDNTRVSYLGSPVSPTNPVPFGQAATGSLRVSNISTGTIYEINVKGVFQNGDTSLQTLTITAQT